QRRRHRGATGGRDDEGVDFPQRHLRQWSKDRALLRRRQLRPQPPQGRHRVRPAERRARTLCRQARRRRRSGAGKPRQDLPGWRAQLPSAAERRSRRPHARARAQTRGRAHRARRAAWQAAVAFHRRGVRQSGRGQRRRRNISRPSRGHVRRRGAGPILADGGCRQARRDAGLVHGHAHVGGRRHLGVQPARHAVGVSGGRMFPPDRIVCLTEEPVETLYRLGGERRMFGLSGSAVRPARVRKENPRVSAFISADFQKILALEPDLVLTFSDLQADIVAELIRRNIAVHAFNHRDVAGIFDMIRTLGALTAVTLKADALAESLERRLEQMRNRTALLDRRPRVYFEELDEPMISGIRWVAELIEIAGGIDVFPMLSRRKNAKDRIVSREQVIAAAPDIIVGSWCGKKFVPAKVAARPGFAEVPAVRDGFLREIKSTVILQPGPAALADGPDAGAGLIAGGGAAAPRAEAGGAGGGRGGAGGGGGAGPPRGPAEERVAPGRDDPP